MKEVKIGKQGMSEQMKALRSHIRSLIFTREEAMALIRLIIEEMGDE